MNPNWLPVQIITPYLKIAKFGAIRLGFLLTLEFASSTPVVHLRQAVLSCFYLHYSAPTS